MGAAGALPAGNLSIILRKAGDTMERIEGDKDVDDPPDRSGRYPGGLGGNLLVLSPQAFSGSPGRACRFLEDCALFVVDFPHVERVRQAT